MPSTTSRARMSVAFTTGVLLVAAMIGVAQPAAAAPIVDQDSPGFTNSSGIFRGGQELGQTFTAGLSGQMTALRLSVGGDGPTTLRILDGGIDGTVVSGATIPAGSQADQIVNLVQPVPVVAGNLYAFTVSTNVGFNVLGHSQESSYAGGQDFNRQIAYGSPWYPGTSDFSFTTYVDQASNVEPSISGAPNGRYATGNAFDFSYAVAGSPAPTVTVTAGQLPPGLTISPAGRVTGTPSAACTYTFTLTANNGWGAPAVLDSSITIVPAAAPSTPGTPSVVSGDGKLTVSWAASAPGDRPLTTYMATTTSGKGCATTLLTCDIIGLVNGTSYSVSVVAASSAGSSSPTTPVTGTPARVPGIPSISVSAGNEQVTIGITAPVDGGSPIQGYEIWRYDGATVANYPVPAFAQAIHLPGLINGRTYTFQIRAFNAQGAGAWSAPVPATPRTTAAAPVLAAAVPGDRSLQLSWSTPYDGGGAITSYDVSTVDGTIIKSVPATDATTSLGSLLNGTEYQVRVRAVNAAGAGAWSNTVAGTPRTTPSVPTAVAATPGNGMATVTWGVPSSNGGSSITAYELDVVGSIQFQQPASTTWFTFPRLTNGLEYSFRVRAVNAAGPGPWSSVVAVTPRTVPTEPLSLTASPGDGSAILEWALPSWNGGAAISVYDVQYSSDGQTWQDAPQTTATSSTVTGLTNGTPYSFRVRAANAAGNGAWSTRAQTTPHTVPAAPNISSVVPGDGTLDVAWDEPSAGGSPITSYLVQYAASSGQWGPSSAVSDTRLTLLGLENGVGHDVRVAAVNAAGTGPWSAVASATPRTVAGAPTWGAITPGDEQVDLEWLAPSAGGAPITGYESQWSVDGISWTDIDDSAALTVTAVGLTNGSNYGFRVRAVNAAGPGPWSTVAIAIPRTTPAAASDATVVPSDGGVSITWDAPADGGAPLQGYEVEYRPASTGFWTSAPLALTSPATVTGLENGQRYEFRVRAINAAGPGPWSDIIASTPFLFAPSFTTPDGASLEGTLKAGSAVVVSGSDLPVGATVTLEFHSDPITLATATVGADGTFQLRSAIPVNAVGAHELVVFLSNTGAPVQTARIGVTIAAANELVTAGTEGIELLAWSIAILLLGTALVLRSRKRRRLSVADQTADSAR